MAKSKCIAYTLWLFTGVFGIHHFYLGRDKQAFIWYTTIGGFFIGFIRDFFRLNDYIDQANNDEDYMERLKKKMKHLKAPSFDTLRFLSSIIVGFIYGMIVQYALPKDYETNYFLIHLLFKLLAPFAIAIGVYLTHTESYMKCQFRYPLIGAYAAIIPHLMGHKSSLLYCAISSAMFLNWKIQWRDLRSSSKSTTKNGEEKEKKRSLKKRIVIFILCASVYTCFTASFVLNNATITINDETITLKDSILNFIGSKAFKDLKSFGLRMWHIYSKYGYEKLKEEFLNGIDASGISRAYEILELSESVDQKELDARCKQLSRKWHPDRFKDETQKLEAQQKFMDIQEACNKVSSYRRNKMSINKQSEKDDDTGSDESATKEKK